jgi:hypothetical protein
MSAQKDLRIILEVDLAFLNFLYPLLFRQKIVENSYLIPQFS